MPQGKQTRSDLMSEELPEKKKRKTPSYLLSSLPEDLTLNCLARVSRSDQAALSRVSKTYRFLITSPELYKTRSLLRCTENCLYVCLLTPRNPNPCWFILLRRGNHRFRRPIPGDHFQAPEGSAVVTLDSGIYVIGGMIKGKPTSHVLFLDCRTHTWRWHQVPSMGAARSSAAAGVVGGKIYVFGGCEDPDSSNWGEVFDPKTQTWDSLIPMPDRKTRCQYINNSFVVKDEKVYAVDLMERSFYYSPSEGEWQKGNHAQAIAIRRDKCLIDKTIYCIDPLGRLYWCELEQLEREPKGEEEGMYWRNVKGLESLEKSLSSSRLVHFDGMLEALWETRKIGFGIDKKLIDLLPGARLSNSGSNIVLLWDVLVEEEDRRRLEIWCAEISLERRCQGGTTEIWGNVEWSNAVMTIDPFLHHYKVLHSVSINI